MTGKHSYDHIADLFQDIFNKFSLLREQIVSIVTDNGSNFVKAFKEFGYDIQDMRDDIDYDDEGFYFLDIFNNNNNNYYYFYYYSEAEETPTFSSYCRR